MPSALLFNLYEFRTGIWLPKAYLVGLDAGGRPREVHQTARPELLSTYDIAATPANERALELTAALRDRAVAEHFRRGARTHPTLAKLVAPSSRDRTEVLRYVHARTAELLALCRAEGYFVTTKLDPRASPYPHLLAFADRDLEPVLYFSLNDTGLTYRLRILLGDGSEALVRHLDPHVITNRPAPGWVQLDRRLARLRGLRGDALRPFLTRDAVEVPPDDVGRYFREFVARAARAHRIRAEGFPFLECTAPDGLRLRATPHPFTEVYRLEAEFVYGNHAFALGDPDTVAVTCRDRPPYAVTRIVRDPAAEDALLRPLLDRGLRETGERRALTHADDPAPFANLAWLLTHRTELQEAGVTVEEPTADGHAFSNAPGRLDLSVAEAGDWLDLRATVHAGEHVIPFARLVKHLREGDRRYLLPDGTWFLIPEDWFTRYAPGLALARVTGERVRLQRAHAPLLERLGVAGTTAAPPPPVAAAAGDYTPGPELRATLRPYQLEGARWLVAHYRQRLGACLADDMGLGKTLQTIAVLVHAKAQARAPREIVPAPDLFSTPADDEDFLQPLRALIILPASLVYNWTTELARFAPGLSVLPNVGTKRIRDGRVLRRYDAILTTYQTALRDQDALRQLDAEFIVLDESQQIKNRKSKVFRTLNALPARHRISLSGTPIENSLSDLWSQMQFINPGLLGSFAFFRRHFLQPIEQHDDARRKAQLRELVEPYVLRRTKAEVAPDLPELDTQVYYCEMTPQQARRYDRERAAARNALLGLPAEEESGGGDYKLRVIQALTRLRQLANHPVIAAADYAHDSGKFAEVCEQLDTLWRAGHKVLVFSSMVRHLELYRAWMEERGQAYAWITGDVAADVRAREVARFQEDAAVGTFFISIRAGGVGLNLTAADYVFLLDPWWNPTVEDQAIARAHRIGRRGNVFARRFITKGTLEEKIHQLQRRKRRLADEIIDGGARWDLEPGEIDFLLT